MRAPEGHLNPSRVLVQSDGRRPDGHRSRFGATRTHNDDGDLTGGEPRAPICHDQTAISSPARSATSEEETLVEGEPAVISDSIDAGCDQPHSQRPRIAPDRRRHQARQRQPRRIGPRRILGHAAPAERHPRSTSTSGRSHPVETTASLLTRASRSKCPGASIPRLHPPAKPVLASGSTTRMWASRPLRAHHIVERPVVDKDDLQAVRRPVRRHQRVQAVKRHLPAVEMEHDDAHEGQRHP